MTRFKSIAATAALLLCGTVAHGVPVSGSQFLNFQAGTQSLWGPGGAAASFQADGAVGNSTLGFNYELKASSGTVERASFDGFLNYSYEDGALVSDADLVSVGFNGSSNGGLIDTLFGLSIETNWQVLGFTGCIYCQGASLDVDRTFTARLDTPVSGSDTATPATVAVGPDILIASVQAGVDVDVRQTSTLEGTGIRGQISAVHQGSGEIRTHVLDLTDDGLFSVDLGLDLVGIWDVSLTDLMLDNRFFSSFRASPVPFVQYTAGLGCGDPGTDSDNVPIACGGDGRADWNLANISLGNTRSFALAFNSLNLNPFSINVVDSVAVAVPEPGSLTLLGAGMLALGWLRRRHVADPRTRSGASGRSD